MKFRVGRVGRVNSLFQPIPALWIAMEKEGIHAFRRTP